MNNIKQILRAVLTRIGLIFFGLLLTFIILELAFRSVYPDPSPKLVNQALQPHNTYGISFTPNTEGWNTSLRGEYSTYITINDKGLRGQAYDYTKSSDMFRILVLGDSFTAALQVAKKNLFTSLLAEQLESLAPKNKSIEIINAGVVGYGTTNQLAYLTHEGYKYEPDIVLLMFFMGNDVRDNIAPAHYQLVDNALIPIEFAYSSQVGTPPWAQDGTFFRRVRNYLYTHSRVYSVSIELLTYTIIQQSPQLSNLLQSVGFVEATRPVTNVGNIYSYLQPPEEAWKMTEALLIELNKQVNFREGQLIVAIIPDETEIDEMKWNKLSAEYPDIFQITSDYNRPTDQLAQILDRHTIPYLQLRSFFKQYQQEAQESIYYQYDGHWMPSAHKLAAQAIYDFFSEHRHDFLHNLNSCHKDGGQCSAK